MEGVRKLAALAAVCIGVVACGSQAALAAESASQLLADGRHSLDALTSYQVHGTFTVNQSSGLMTATVLKDGDASGSLTIGVTSGFVLASRTYYFDTLNTLVTGGMDPWLANVIEHLKGQHWW